LRSIVITITKIGRCQLFEHLRSLSLFMTKWIMQRLRTCCMLTRTKSSMVYLDYMFLSHVHFLIFYSKYVWSEYVQSKYVRSKYVRSKYVQSGQTKILLVVLSNFKIVWKTFWSSGLNCWVCSQLPLFLLTSSKYGHV